MKTYRYKIFPGGVYFPVIEIGVLIKGAPTKIFALIDSGASTCLFNAETAGLLGINFKKGEKIQLGGVGGNIKGYVHRLLLKVADKLIKAPVIFSENYSSSFNLLGREGIFENFKITFDEKSLQVKIE